MFRRSTWWNSFRIDWINWFNWWWAAEMGWKLFVLASMSFMMPSKRRRLRHATPPVYANVVCKFFAWRLSCHRRCFLGAKTDFSETGTLLKRFASSIQPCHFVEFRHFDWKLHSIAPRTDFAMSIDGISHVTSGPFHLPRLPVPLQISKMAVLLIFARSSSFVIA